MDLLNKNKNHIQLSKLSNLSEITDETFLAQDSGTDSNNYSYRSVLLKILWAGEQQLRLLNIRLVFVLIFQTLKVQLH
jgi:hypothetical protein